MRPSECLPFGRGLHTGRIPSSDQTVFIKGDQLEAGRGSKKNNRVPHSTACGYREEIQKMPRGRLQVGGEWKGKELLLQLHRAGECELESGPHSPAN